MKNKTKRLSDLSLDAIFSTHEGFVIDKFFLAVNKELPDKVELITYQTFDEVSEVLESKFKMSKFRDTLDLGMSKSLDIPEAGDRYRTRLYTLNFTDDQDVMVKIAAGRKNGVEVSTNMTLVHNLKDSAVIEEFKTHFTSFIKPNEGKTVGFISLVGNYWDVEEVIVTDVPNIDFDLNYNDDFDHGKIKELIDGDSPKHGIILLGGVPGSGKTNYIRWLMANSKKRFVYMPSNQIPLMSSPSFIQFALTELKNSVIIMEDCEDVLISRDEMRGGEVQTILNLSDGILGSALNLTLIGTYNVKDSIDKALFRKGRLMYMYDFDNLNAEKATKLSTKLGHNITYTIPTILTNVYNIEDNNGKVETVRASVGFR